MSSLCSYEKSKRPFLFFLLSACRVQDGYFFAKNKFQIWDNSKLGSFPVIIKVLRILMKNLRADELCLGVLWFVNYLRCVVLLLIWFRKKLKCPHPLFPKHLTKSCYFVYDPIFQKQRGQSHVNTAMCAYLVPLRGNGRLPCVKMFAVRFSSGARQTSTLPCVFRMTHVKQKHTVSIYFAVRF
jgi:hypothetical protein